MAGGSYTAQKEPSAFSQVVHHTATSLGDKIYMFGGRSYAAGEHLSRYSNRLCVFDTRENVLEDMVVAGPTATGRRGHCACLANDKLFIFGGNLAPGVHAGGGHAVWYFDVVLQEWEKVSPQLRRLLNLSQMSADFMSTRGEIMIFGGKRTSRITNELHALDVHSNKLSAPPTTGAPPSPRRGHMSCSTGDSIVIVGGCEFLFGDSSISMDVYVLSSQGRGRLHWSSVDVGGALGPEPRELAASVLIDGRLVLFGGNNGALNYGEVWAFSIRDHTWECLQWASQWTDGETTVESHVVGARYAHTANVVDGEILVLGGFPINNRRIRLALR